MDLTPNDAAARCGDSDVGWAYVDQQSFCPKLHDLVGLRSLIVKRPAITTTEVLAGPIRGRTRTHFVTGYVHKLYPRIYALLARHARFDSALFVRGVEGSVIPSLQQPSKVFYYHHDSELQEMPMDPTRIGISQPKRAVPIPDQLPKVKKKGDEIAMTVDTDAVAEAAAEAGNSSVTRRAWARV